LAGLQVLGTDLHIGGTFDRAGVEAWGDPPQADFPAASLATWHFGPRVDTWSTPGGTNGWVTALTTLDGRSLVVRGLLHRRGGRRAAASAVARYYARRQP
jgi:hypothetical protein